MSEKPRVLLVDDNLSTLTTLAAILRLNGYDVSAAQGGNVGLEFIESTIFDLIVTDLRMPDVSGLELLAEACERAPHTPVVVFTAWGTTATESAARRLGAVDFIDRLPSSDVLLDSVQRSLVKPVWSSVDDLAAETFGPATLRWLRAVLPVVRSKNDVHRVEDWADILDKGVSTVKRWCERCRVTAAESLDFSRALRIVMRFAGRPCDWYDELGIGERKTLAAFLERSGFSETGPVPSLPEFLHRQQFISNPALLRALRAILNGPR